MNKYIPQEEKFSLQKNNGQFFLAVLCNASDKAISMKFFRTTITRLLVFCERFF
jgi:hypothetical protein